MADGYYRCIRHSRPWRLCTIRTANNRSIVLWLLIVNTSSSCAIMTSAAAAGALVWRRFSSDKRSAVFKSDKSNSIGTVSPCHNSIKPPPYLHRPPLVIGHRGASFDLPEHTLEGYRLALELGADYIEPDLVPTKDGHLVAIHSFDLNITTNVEHVFPGRARQQANINSNNNDDDLILSKSGYYAHDFTLEEIKSLRVKQRLEDTPARTSKMDYLFTIPTLVEILDLLYDWTYNVLPVIERSQSKLTQRKPGVYIELKNPSWILNDTNGSVRVEDILLNTITNHPKSNELFFDPSHHCSNSYDDEEKYEYSVPPLVFQCFEVDTLEYLRRKMLEADVSIYNNVIPPSIFLVSNCWKSDFWTSVATFTATIDGIGPDKSCLLDTDYAQAQHFMDQAKSLNLAVHPWTERLELEFVSSEFNDAEEELRFLFCEMRVDGIFAENVGLAKRVGAVGCGDVAAKDDDGSSSLAFANTTDYYHLRRSIVSFFIVGIFVGGIVVLLIARCWFYLSRTTVTWYQQIQSLPENENHHQTA